MNSGLQHAMCMTEIYCTEVSHNLDSLNLGVGVRVGVGVGGWGSLGKPVRV